MSSFLIFDQKPHAFGQTKQLLIIRNKNTSRAFSLVKNLTHLVKNLTHLVKNKSSNRPALQLFRDLFTCTKYYKYYKVIKNNIYTPNLHQLGIAK